MKKLLYSFAFLLTSTTLFGQATDVSPYSRYALGDISPVWFAHNTALGGSTVAIADSFLVNVLNPASYSFASRHNPIFDVSLRGRIVDLTSSTATRRDNFISLSNMTLVLPIGKRWGGAFGLIPYSSSGYNISYQQESEAIGGTVTSYYSGQGGINRVFAGASYMPVKTAKNILSFGANVSYLFGDLEKTRLLTLPSQTGLFDSKVVSSLFMRDFMVDAGLMYRNRINPRQQVTVGIATAFGTSLSARRSVLANTMEPGSQAFIDTVQYVEGEKGTVYIPPRYNAGLTYDFKGIAGSKNYYKLSLTAQYNYQDWTKYKEEFASTPFTDSLRATSGVSFGVQFIPHVLGSGGGKVNPLKLCNYRVGAYTNKNYLSLNGQSINEWGVTAGIGIPLVNSFSYSMVNISFEYGARGTTANNLLLEKFTGVHVGISFTPNRQVDRWFLKRRFD